MCLLMLFRNSKIHFHQLGQFKLTKTMLKSLNVIKVNLLWNHYPNGSHNTWATKRSIMAYDEFKDRICKE